MCPTWMGKVKTQDKTLLKSNEKQTSVPLPKIQVRFLSDLPKHFGWMSLPASQVRLSKIKLRPTALFLIALAARPCWQTPWSQDDKLHWLPGNVSVLDFSSIYIHWPFRTLSSTSYMLGPTRGQAAAYKKSLLLLIMEPTVFSQSLPCIFKQSIVFPQKPLDFPQRLSLS